MTDHDRHPFDWALTFGRAAAPRVLDAGCGDGTYLLASALARPTHDHLGVDLIRPLIEKAQRAARELRLTNVRFVAGDAVHWLFRRLAPDSLDELHVYHPQPYYDPAEVPRGMLTPAFFERAWQVTRKDGLLVLQTDNKPYGKYLLAAARIHFDPRPHPGPWPDAPLGRTRREAVARRKKLAVLRAVAPRRDTPLDTPPPAPYFDLARPGLRKRRPPRRRELDLRGRKTTGR